MEGNKTKYLEKEAACEVTGKQEEVSRHRRQAAAEPTLPTHEYMHFTTCTGCSAALLQLSPLSHTRVHAHYHMHKLLCSTPPAQELPEKRLLVSQGTWHMCPPAMFLKEARVLGAG